MSERDNLWKIISSDVHKKWAASHPTDANKVTAEWNGVRRPSPASKYAQGLVGLIRANPAPPPPPPPPSGSVLTLPGGLARVPDGNTETAARYAGVDWLAGDIASYTVAQWESVRKLVQAHGGKFGYWMRCRTSADAVRLLQAAVTNKVDLAILNVEQPEINSEFTPAKMAEAIRSVPFAGQVGTALMGWIGYVGGGGQHYGPDYSAIAEWPGFLEIFPEDMGIPGTSASSTWDDCRVHALALGLKQPLQLVQTFHGAQPGWYAKPYSLYTLDDAAPQIASWL